MIALMATSTSKTAVGSVGTIATQFLDLPKPLALDCGRELHPIRIAYETYGTLSPARDNVILVCHALSGDAHAAGFTTTPTAESTRDGFRAEERDAFARRIFNTAPGIKDVKIIRAEPLRMGRASGYEIVADAKDLKSDIEVTTVQWLRFGSTGYMQMLGIARRTAWNDAFTKMRAIRDGIDTQ